MNKKFSTLVAVLLAAGAWTTLEAKVLEVTPIAGGSYLVGTDADLSDGEFDVLLTEEGKGSASVVVAIQSSPTWTLVNDGNDVYSLQQEGKVFVASTNQYTNALTLKDVSSIGVNEAEVKFQLADGRLVIANK